MKTSYTDYVVWDDKSEDIKFIRQAVLDSTKLQGDVHIFVLEEGTAFYIVSELLKTTFQEMNVTGFEFLPLVTSK